MATVSKWTPFGVALDLTATGGTVTRKSATQYTVAINVSWKTYYSGAKTNYGMSVTSGGVTRIISPFGTSRSSGSGTFTGTYSISGNNSASKTITVTFKNYEEDWQGNVTESATKNVTFNVTVPAWTSYAVKYNANGGSGAPANQTKYKDQTLKLSTTKPTRSGYTFLGWGTSASDTSVDYAAGANYTANAAITLYAIWRHNSFTISYNANGGKGAPASQTKTYGVTLTLSNTIPIRSSVDENGTLTEYVFHGWATSSTATSVQYKAGANYTANAAATLYAVWGKVTTTDTYQVSYNVNGGSEVISQTKTHGKALTLRETMPIKNGYTFAGWGLSADSTTVSYNAGDTYTNDESIVLYAIWTPWSHTVVFDLNGGNGEVPESFVKTSGVNTIIPDCQITRKGYKFKYWSTQPSGSGGTNYRAGDGYTGIKNGGTVILYAVWSETSIYFYANGICKADEFIEDEYFTLNNDGTIHYAQFVEGTDFSKNVITYLTDESDDRLIDEFGNYLRCDSLYVREGNSLIQFTPTAFFAAEFFERMVMNLTDESDNRLTDESGNYLIAII